MDGDPTRNYRMAANAIACAGGIPILFPCSAVKSLPGPELISVFRGVPSAREFLDLNWGNVRFRLDASGFGKPSGLLCNPQLKGAGTACFHGNWSGNAWRSGTNCGPSSRCTREMTWPSIR